MNPHTPRRPAAIATLSIIVIGLISGFNAVTTVAAPVADTGFVAIPATMKMRCSRADRMDRLKETGGTPECEEAVVQGLNWLKSTQREEGNWPGNLANTGLALLAYLGHCETPVSVEYGDSCLRAITFLINVAVKNKGWIATGTPATNKAICYEHAINTYAIAEATTFCRQHRINIPSLEKVCQVAGQLITDNQTKQGGWEYSYKEVSIRGGGDLSITAWQLQALKACQLTGIEFRNLSECASLAAAYVEGLSGPSGGFGYSSPGHGYTDYCTLTGAGVLCMQMWEKGSRAAARSGAKYIDQNTKFDYNTRFADLYGHYYESQAMMNRGGEQWRRYNALFRDQLLENQDADGSWKVPGGGKELRAVAAMFRTDTHYRTTLCILMLEVYYRYLPGIVGR